MSWKEKKWIIHKDEKLFSLSYIVNLTDWGHRQNDLWMNAINLTNITIAFIEVNRWWARNAYHFKGQSTGKTS